MKSATTGELEAARAVQQVLVPEAIPRVPGFAIESFYKPAGQVGGDFFQILAIATAASWRPSATSVGRACPPP